MSAKGEGSEAVMIIEDDHLVALALVDFVESFGHRVVGVARSKSGALDLARRTRPDLILSDLTLDRLGDGLEAVEEILAERAVRVVFLTGTPHLVPRMGRFAGFLVLQKPVNVKVLTMVLTGSSHAGRVFFPEPRPVPT